MSDRVYIGHQMQDAVMARRPHNPDAVVLLLLLQRHAQPETPLTDIESEASLAREAQLSAEDLSAALDWLEGLRVVHRVDGRIYLNPNGVYRGRLDRQPAVAEEWARLVAEQA